MGNVGNNWSTQHRHNIASQKNYLNYCTKARLYNTVNFCLRPFRSMRSRSGVAVCCRPCHLTPHPVAPPAAAPPGDAQFLLTLRLPPPPRPPPLSPLLPPPPHLGRGNAPLAKLPPQTADMQNELIFIGPLRGCW